MIYEAIQNQSISIEGLLMHLSSFSFSHSVACCYNLPATVPHQNFYTRICVAASRSLAHSADASSNMYFGRWKNLMIKGTPSDFHLNYNLSLIFRLFISHFLYSGCAASLFVPLVPSAFFLFVFFFCLALYSCPNFLICSSFLLSFIFHLFFLLLCLVLSLRFYLWELKAAELLTWTRYSLLSMLPFSKPGSSSSFLISKPTVTIIAEDAFVEQFFH